MNMPLKEKSYMSNKELGNSYENYVIRELQKKGYWVHLLKDNQNGQPFDIIAIGSQFILCLDAKHCVGNRFDFKNIRENQLNSFDYLSQFHNPYVIRGFVIGDLNEPLRILTYGELERLKLIGMKSTYLEQLNQL